MKNYDQLVEINHNLSYSYRILILIVGCGSGKNSVLLNYINHQQPDIDKIYLYVNIFNISYSIYLISNTLSWKFLTKEKFNKYIQIICLTLILKKLLYEIL